MGAFLYLIQGGGGPSWRDPGQLRKPIPLSPMVLRNLRILVNLSPIPPHTNKALLPGPLKFQLKIAEFTENTGKPWGNAILS